ncbi:MAG: hypothetical protein HUJ72_09840 [Blautia sp.]|nr:hypothetical protein [Blautia sp.]
MTKEIGYVNEATGQLLIEKPADPMKGPFWILTDEDGHIAAYPVSVDLTPVPSHKTVWPILKDVPAGVPWNYYPRGRVEIRRDKAIIFANPRCFECDRFEEEIIEAFHLDFMEVVYKVDNSSHYQCLIDDMKDKEI